MRFPHQVVAKTKLCPWSPQVHVHIKRHSMEELPQTDEGLALWCRDLFVAKARLQTPTRRPKSARLKRGVPPFLLLSWSMASALLLVLAGRFAGQIPRRGGFRHQGACSDWPADNIIAGKLIKNRNGWSIQEHCPILGFFLKKRMNPPVIWSEFLPKMENFLLPTTSRTDVWRSSMVALVLSSASGRHVLVMPSDVRRRQISQMVNSPVNMEGDPLLILLRAAGCSHHAHLRALLSVWSLHSRRGSPHHGEGRLSSTNKARNVLHIILYRGRNIYSPLPVILEIV